MSTRRHFLRSAAWLAVNLLGVVACLGAIGLLALAGAIVLDRVSASWDAFAWLCVADAGLIVATLSAAGDLSRRYAPLGSWTTH